MDAYVFLSNEGFLEVDYLMFKTKEALQLFFLNLSHPG